VGADGRSFPIGRLSGRHGLRNKIERMGFQLSEAELEAAFRSMKELLDTKKHVTDAELLGLIQDACTDSRRQSAG
jgi:2-isopropylmalate synthase